MSENNNKKGRPQKYVFWSDWSTFINKEWNPFRYNDLPHLKRDIVWIKFILGGMLIAIIGSAIAILTQT